METLPQILDLFVPVDAYLAEWTGRSPSSSPAMPSGSFRA